MHAARGRAPPPQRADIAPGGLRRGLCARLLAGVVVHAGLVHSQADGLHVLRHHVRQGGRRVRLVVVQVRGLRQLHARRD